MRRQEAGHSPALSRREMRGGSGCPSRDGIRRACVETPGRSRRRELCLRRTRPASGRRPATEAQRDATRAHAACQPGTWSPGRPAGSASMASGGAHATASAATREHRIRAREGRDWDSAPTATGPGARGSSGSLPDRAASRSGAAGPHSTGTPGRQGRARAPSAAPRSSRGPGAAPRGDRGRVRQSELAMGTIWARSRPRGESADAQLPGKKWWAGTGLNRRHQDFQACYRIRFVHYSLLSFTRGGESKRNEGDPGLPERAARSMSRNTGP
jgi:hypothetical protein